MDALSTQAGRLAALGHPVRLAILRQVVQGEVAGTPVGEIQQALGIPASTLSHHLGTLSAAQLVRIERQGTTLRYRADFDTLRALTTFIWEDCCGRRSTPKDLVADDGAGCCVPDLFGAPMLAPSAALRPDLPSTASTAWSPDFD